MKKLLIDCDTGIDDSIAILYALKHPRVRVLGICTGYGNSSAEQSTENTLRIIKLAQPGYEVPVAVGAAAPLNGIWPGPNAIVHGANGIGDVELPESTQKPIGETAPEFIVRMAREHPGELTLVTLGRLTNLALALRLEPKLPQLLQNVVSMGGTVFAAGNCSPVAEANIAGDPEAADIVMSAGFELLQVGLDVTHKVQLTAAHLAALDRYCAPENRAIADYILAAMKHYFRFNRMADYDLDHCPVHDPLAMLLAVDPSSGVYRKMPARVECGGTYCRGMLVTDRRVVPFDSPYITVCLDVDVTRAVETLLAVFMERDPAI